MRSRAASCQNEAYQSYGLRSRSRQKRARTAIVHSGEAETPRRVTYDASRRILPLVPCSPIEWSRSPSLPPKERTAPVAIQRWLAPGRSGPFATRGFLHKPPLSDPNCPDLPGANQRWIATGAVRSFGAAMVTGTTRWANTGTSGKILREASYVTRARRLASPE